MSICPNILRTRETCYVTKDEVITIRILGNKGKTVDEIATLMNKYDGLVESILIPFVMNDEEKKGE